MSAIPHHPGPAEGASGFDARANELNDPRPHPLAAALDQYGVAVMTELLDLVLATALEDQVNILAEALIGGLHSATQRLEREADRRRDRLSLLLRDFDGTEVADVQLQEVRAETLSLDVAAEAAALMRDAASATYSATTGLSWTPWRGDVRKSRRTAALLDARAVLAEARRRRSIQRTPSGPIVVVRGAPFADSAEDASRLFDGLNWAKREWPQFVLGLTGALGVERLALIWARQKGVQVVLARPDFAGDGRAAPFRVNDLLLELSPVCVLVLAQSLAEGRGHAAFGPALNLAQKASKRGIRVVRICAKPPPT